MAKEKKEVVAISKDDLAHSLADVINKQFKGDKIAHFLDENTEAPTEVKEWVSTGSSILDIAISNRKNGGFPVGKIVEITGLEASGKSLICAHAVKSTQSKGGLTVYIDTESAMNKAFAEAVGVDTNEMLYVQMERLEDIFVTIENIIAQIRKVDKDRLVTIIVDSVMGSSTKDEIESDYDREGWATGKAIIISKALRKITGLIAKQRILLIFTNQLRAKLGVSFGDPWTTSGGKALSFHASVRLRLKAVGQIKVPVEGVEQVMGIKTSVQVIKNRVGPPLRSSTFNIFFDRGIDDFGSWLDVLKDYGLVSQAGSWYTFVHEELSQPIKFLSKDWDGILSGDDHIRQLVYDLICDKIVMRYRSNNFGIDDIVLSNEPVPED